ncbi:MAG: PIG-L deacetylase family protein [Planctomycetota bacterium]
MELPRILEPPPGRVLVLAPHPDDESCGLGGTLARHRAQGDPVRVCFLTDGGSGDPDGREAGDVAALRQREARAAAEVLGGLDCEFWGYPDGFEVNEGDLRMVGTRMADAIRSWRADLVYVPWEGEAHSDHANAWAALRVALRLLRAEGGGPLPRVLEYEVWSPLPADWIIDVTSTAEKKRAAMLAHASQVAYTDYPHQLMGLAAHRSVYLPKSSRYGEAFREGRSILE